MLLFIEKYKQLQKTLVYNLVCPPPPTPHRTLLYTFIQRVKGSVSLEMYTTMICLLYTPAEFE